MTKYKIEGGIDFYTELYKSLDIEDTISDFENICLITNKPLTDKHVIMKCGHKFNYYSIYKDIVNHKQKFNGMETQTGRLNTRQIRCPYCRKKQDTLLPYYEELGLAKVHGVNFYDPNFKQPIKTYEKCMYKYPNDMYDPSKPETDTNSKYLINTQCSYHHSSNINASKIQIYNYSNPLQPITFGDNNAYCYNHKIIMINHYNAEQKQKIKDEAKIAKALKKQQIKEEKQQIKDDAKIAKALKKQQIKEEKLKLKDDAKLLKTKAVKNVILGPSIITTETPIQGCIALLKFGSNKGKYCGCAIKTENMCQRHLKLVNNI